MLHTIEKLIGENKKKLYYPIFLMSIDSIGSMVLYFVLDLTVLDLFYGTLSMQKIVAYTFACLLNDVGSFEGVLSHALSFLMKTVVLCALILIGTFFIDWKLALAECAVLVLAVPLLHWGNRLIERLGSQKRDLTNRMISTMLEYIRGIKVFKSYNMTSAHFDRLLSSLEQVRKISAQIECEMAPPTAFYSILVNFLMPLVLLGGSYMLLGGQIKGESLIAFLIMSIAISGLLVSFEHYYILLKDLKLAAGNLERAVDMKPLAFKESDFTLKHFDVSFQDVCFSYDSGTQVLHHVTFHAPEGSVTALIGPSGSGKSTITNLIARFWDVTGGYDTVLAEGGASLSGGEKQRIAIARAILKNPPVLLLDESTASLDADNETKINMALDQLMQGKTVFVIAHRLNTIKHADQIILLNGGAIAETGNHDALMAAKGHYYEMVQEQEKANVWAAQQSR